MKRVLLIDDDPNEQKLFQFYLLKRFGPQFELHYVSSTEDAAEFLLGNTVDAIFLDNRLKPHRDYRETAPSFMALAGTTPVYLISASVDEPAIREHGTYGISQVIDKFHVKDSIVMQGLLG